MIPLSDENPTLRTPIMTWILLGALFAVWVAVQGGGFDQIKLVTSICNLGMVPAELMHRLPVGYEVPIAPGIACVIDNDPINSWTPLISMFLHGGWWHLLGNALYFWVFGNNIEDSMGPGRFLAFYLLCGFVASAAQVMANPASPIPTVGASGAISGVLGAYLVLYPHARVNMFFGVFVARIRAWIVLAYWFGMQVLSVYAAQVEPAVSGGVAVQAHVGGFLAGVLLVKLFEKREMVAERKAIRDNRQRLTSDHD